MNKELNKQIYYDIGETLTHNCLFNFVCGNRSAGKTYGFKKWAISSWIRTGRQFAYVRRYETGINKGKLSAFFDDVRVEFPEYEFKVEGLTFFARLLFKSDDANAKNPNKWEVIGYCFVLSKAVTFKSVPYPMVDKILFDEFLIDKGNYRYLPDEVNKFNDLYVTIARPGSTHCDVIVFFMSNAISFTNIYFLAYNLKQPAPGQRFYKVKGKDILLQMVSKDEMIARQKQTRFGKIIEGTRYEQFAFENKFYLDDDTFIEKRSDSAKYVFSMIYQGQTIGCWIDYREGIIYASEKFDPYGQAVYAITQKDHKPNTMLLRGLSRTVYLKMFVEMYADGNVRFENMKVKNLCYEIIRMCNVR